MYSITLADGTRLENLELNGNNYIAQEAVDDSIFDGNLDSIVISDGETETTYTDVWLMSNIVRDGRSWIVLGEKSAEQKEKETLEARVDELTKALNTLLGVE